MESMCSELRALLLQLISSFMRPKRSISKERKKKEKKFPFPFSGRRMICRRTSCFEIKKSAKKTRGARGGVKALKKLYINAEGKSSRYYQRENNYDKNRIKSHIWAFVFRIMLDGKLFLNPKRLIESRHLGFGAFLDPPQMNSKKRRVIISNYLDQPRKACLTKETLEREFPVVLFA
ncbi:hypothetical protein CEXT_407351 [Caerostris extrusa]|uniref:Uncharacterized protein n=1 Tax=Caerostris extrusa TaxID=172846 RepID=A0AAV4RMD4_CAEEX|nr:hypothetical protein CEXT_407351 [Caerostris extrusa]